MLCGLFEPSSGDAFVVSQEYNPDRTASTRPNHVSRSIRNTNDLERIHQSMGVCPQHDVLWDDLTAREHLLFYGRLKGLSGSTLTTEIANVLQDVQLTFAADRPCGKYSGGMKRRLSVANALVGSPKVVYLDEPSTGLDPASRRTLWDCIVSAKGHDKSIVLTTHSMEGRW